MPNPTRQEIINAYEALSNLAAFASRYAEDMVEMNQTLGWNETIKAALPPKPQPTMAEIKWDDDKHYLAEADHATTRKVIMLHPTSDGKIECLNKWDGLYRIYWFTPAYLTPTGKRYALKEIQE